jgi:hypothetical protein
MRKNKGKKRAIMRNKNKGNDEENNGEEKTRVLRL